MRLVCLQDVSKSIAERVLFENVELCINEGDKVGLIGLNGSGKTTLLRMVVGLEPPDEGSIERAAGLKLGYLPQDPVLDEGADVLQQLFASDDPGMSLLREYRRATAELEREPRNREAQEKLIALASDMDRTASWNAEIRAKTILSRLGITGFDSAISSLSGGERKRVALARSLLEPAGLLILDEPTNHIDADTIAWLEEHLRSTPGALFLVTHDRYFLDRVVNRIIELDRRVLTAYPGSYRQYLELRTARHERLSAAEERRKKTLLRELDWLRRSPKARTTKQKARRERINELRSIAYSSGEESVMIALSARRLGKRVLEVNGLEKSYGGNALFKGLDLTLEPGERIGIIGPNGSGKSTFLDILAGITTPDAGSVTWGDTAELGYFDQHGSALDDSLRVIEIVEEEAPLIIAKNGARLSAFRVCEWFLFDRQAQHALVGSLSGGERRRLQLLLTLIARPNVLFLDEPTNDLDIPTLSVLEDFLDHFEGSLIVASHDRYFLDRTVDQLVFFDGGRFGARYPTPFEVYERLRREAESGERRAGRRPEAAPRRPAKTRVSPTSDEKRGLTWKEQRELEHAERRVAELEERRQELLSEMEGTATDHVTLLRLFDELAAVDSELESVLGRWLELSEMAGPD